jgi:hypothetical protein
VALASLTSELDRSHGRIVRRSLWVADAAGLDFPHATRAARIRGDRYDRDGSLMSKDIVHAVTSLGADRATAADLAGIARAGEASSPSTGSGTPPGQPGSWVLNVRKPRRW